MSSTPQIIERHPRCVEILIRQRPGIVSYILGAALTLDAAYTGTASMITVGTGRSYQSKTLRRNKINQVDDALRGFTKISYDPTDYASATVPGDQQVSFLRLTEVDRAGVSGPEGPILVLPTPAVWSSNKPFISLNGTAPEVADGSDNLPPVDAMWVNFPRASTSVGIYNDGLFEIAVCLGPAGSQEFLLPAGSSNTEQFPWGDLSFDTLSIRGRGGASAFRLVVFGSNGVFL